jgi:hypothetical protein
MHTASSPLHDHSSFFLLSFPFTNQSWHFSPHTEVHNHSHSSIKPHAFSQQRRTAWRTNDKQLSETEISVFTNTLVPAHIRNLNTHLRHSSPQKPRHTQSAETNRHKLSPFSLSFHQQNFQKPADKQKSSERTLHKQPNSLGKCSIPHTGRKVFGILRELVRFVLRYSFTGILQWGFSPILPNLRPLGTSNTSRRPPSFRALPHSAENSAAHSNQQAELYPHTTGSHQRI